MIPALTQRNGGNGDDPLGNGLRICEVGSQPDPSPLPAECVHIQVPCRGWRKVTVRIRLENGDRPYGTTES